MKSRQTPRRSDEIAAGIRQVKSFARKDLQAIHLVDCDFQKVKRKPHKYDVTKQEDGRYVTVFRGRLIEIRSADDPVCQGQR